jgi:hypothetical protein
MRRGKNRLGRRLCTQPCCPPQHCTVPQAGLRARERSCCTNRLPAPAVCLGRRPIPNAQWRTIRLNSLTVAGSAQCPRRMGDSLPRRSSFEGRMPGRHRKPSSLSRPGRQPPKALSPRAVAALRQWAHDAGMNNVTLGAWAAVSGGASPREPAASAGFAVEAHRLPVSFLGRVSSEHLKARAI